jgi:acetyl esterase/lipase
MVSVPDVSITKDRVYASEARPRRWDVYRSQATPASAPAILALHGGGWRGGDRSMMQATCEAFARLGYVAIAPEYRLIGEVAWPIPLTDVLESIRAAHASATTLGINPRAIFLAGYSAGAHLALLAAHEGASAGTSGRRHTEASVAGVAAFFPPVQLTAFHAELLGIDSRRVAALSPLAHAEKLPPTIIFSGDADPLTPPQFALDLYRAIRAAHGVCDMRLYSHLIHEFVSLPRMTEVTVRDTTEFFSRTVLQRENFDSALQELQKWWDSQLGQSKPGNPN